MSQNTPPKKERSQMLASSLLALLPRRQRRRRDLQGRHLPAALPTPPQTGRRRGSTSLASPRESAEVLAEHAQANAREVTLVSDARLDRSTGPLAL